MEGRAGLVNKGQRGGDLSRQPLLILPEDKLEAQRDDVDEGEKPSCLAALEVLALKVVAIIHPRIAGAGAKVLERHLCLVGLVMNSTDADNAAHVRVDLRSQFSGYTDDGGLEALCILRPTYFYI